MYSFYQLNKYVSFQLPKLAPDEVGGYEAVWEDKFSAWTKVMPINPSAAAKGLKKPKPWKYKLIVRFDMRINSQMRIIYQSQILHIDQIVNVEEKNTFLEIFVLKRGEL